MSTLAPSEDHKPAPIEPDLEFIRALKRQGGDSVKKCFQCGTCSATCDVSPDSGPFPRKEMAWAAWGRKDRLLADPDVWLCYQCNDCSTRCPRTARPGNVLAAVRQECVAEYAVPRFLARWVGQPACIPLVLGIPAAVLTLALVVREPIERALGMSREAGRQIIFSYSAALPHWLLNTVFGILTLLVVLAMVAGVGRFWRAMKAAAPDALNPPAKPLGASIVAALKSALAHDDFSTCTTARPRFVSHLLVFYGFVALTLVTLWVITARYNPLVQGDFVYPFGFFNPWKMLANLGGVAVVAGCLLMIKDRVKNPESVGPGGYSDWCLITTLLLVVLTGFVTEILHYLRLEPHRHLAYFVHLVFAFALLMYLPYSKLAHLAYRAAAVVFAEHTGRKREATPAPAPAASDQSGDQGG